MLLHNIDFSKLRPSRSGIIPYIKRGDQVFFLLGLDSDNNEWSDFGGGVKKYENALSGGMRECMEEIRWIITFQDLDTIKIGIMGSKKRTCIMFARIKDETFFETAKKRFHQKHNESHEMKDIIWLNEKDMLRYSRISCRGSKIWKHIRYVLSNCGSFNRKFIKNL